MFRQNLPEQPAGSDDSSYFPTFQREMNRLIDQFRNGFPIPEAVTRAGYGATLFPAIDVVETDDALEVSAEVPGVREEDLEASISGKTLTLKGEKSSEHEETKDAYHRYERQYGSFRRQISLGFTPQDDAVEADFSDGVLKLRIAKPPAEKADTLKIDISKK